MHRSNTMRSESTAKLKKRFSAKNLTKLKFQPFQIDTASDKMARDGFSYAWKLPQSGFVRNARSAYPPSRHANIHRELFSSTARRKAIPSLMFKKKFTISIIPRGALDHWPPANRQWSCFVKVSTFASVTGPYWRTTAT